MSEQFDTTVSLGIVPLLHLSRPFLKPLGDRKYKNLGEPSGPQVTFNRFHDFSTATMNDYESQAIGTIRAHSTQNKFGK